MRTFEYVFSCQNRDKISTIFGSNVGVPWSFAQGIYKIKSDFNVCFLQLY